MIRFAGEDWLFVNPSNHELTQVFASPAKSAETRFEVIASADLESIEVVVYESGREPLSLGVKSHHYLFYILAKARIDDSGLNIPEKDQGWITTHQLSAMMKLEVNHINIQVYRLRKGIIEATGKRLQAGKILNRRNGAIRLGISDISLK